jgi:hypothetical protein
MGNLGGDAVVMISVIWAIIPLAGMFAGVIVQWFRTKERLRAIEKGVPLPALPAPRIISPEERTANMRVGGIISIALSFGLFVLFAGLAFTTPRFPNGVVAVPAIPFFVGVGFLIEYRLRRKESALSPDAQTP